VVVSTLDELRELRAEALKYGIGEELARIEALMSVAERLEGEATDDWPATRALTTEPHVCGPSGVVQISPRLGWCVQCSRRLVGAALLAAGRRSPTKFGRLGR
jgi:hypothetical protein